ncbi:pirin family protein [Spirosoma flavum]|uniref:Pirin n=1 Tax=Spirosoma flavum TaxID=2048557 RepID=A0ABW6ALJ3_9BACT
MNTQTQAQLYLSEQRGCTQIDYFRSYHSFNFGQYSNENKKPFGSLHVLNDDTLKASHSIKMQVDGNTDVLLLPIVGGLEYKSSLGIGFLDAGQVQIFSLANGMTYEIINPYESELINFIEIWLPNRSSIFLPKIRQIRFNLADKNKLLPLFSLNSTNLNNHQQSRGFIGKYDGRKSGIYPIEKSENGTQLTGVFVFVLSGVFEVQNRLLHERDGLSLMNIHDSDIEFEALSNEAILLLLEIPLKS